MDAAVVLAFGGLACGIAAGSAAQYGRLCTFAAIEDALIGGDLRRVRAWILAIAIAVAATQALVAVDALDLAAAPYGGKVLAVGGVLFGGLLFGLGMSLVGTCAFGLLVRAGSGDLRALLMVAVVGIFAFAATGGFLAPVRLALADLVVIDMSAVGGASFAGLARTVGGPPLQALVSLVLVAIAAGAALACPRIRRKLRLVAASVVLGLAVAGGWFVTGTLADPFSTPRTESLTFVAPVGRTLLAAMGQSLDGALFAVLSVFGVVAGSFLVAFARNEHRWEAFDDQREMRRHIVGAGLMGFGGVLAQGCTIGQGLSAASTLALSAPLAVAGMVLGARIGLLWLLEGGPKIFHRTMFPAAGGPTKAPAADPGPRGRAWL